MQFTTALLPFFLGLVAPMSLVSAAPLAATTIEQRDVYTPPVTYPHTGTVWKEGETHHVKWNTANPPKQITNSIGEIFLRKGDKTLPTKLAGNFSILDGSHTITVPKVTAGNDYRIVLFGDSGNWSEEFTISK